MSKFVVVNDTIVKYPVFIEAESYEEALRKTVGDYTFEEVDNMYPWQFRVTQIDDMATYNDYLEYIKSTSKYSKYYISRVVNTHLYTVDDMADYIKQL